MKPHFACQANDGPVDLEQYSPICLPDLSVTAVRWFYRGRMASVTGWGDTTGKGNYPGPLKELQDSFPITLNQGTKCGSSLLTKDTFCTGKSRGDGQFCSGDSGSPVTLEVKIKQFSN